MDLKEYITGVNAQIKAFAENLAKETKADIEALEVKAKAPSLEQLAKEKDRPDRPWKLLGSAAVAVSAVKLLLANGSSTWPYLVGGIGIASVAYGFFLGQKRKNMANVEKPIDYNEVINGQISSIRPLLDAAGMKWEKYTDAVKSEVQNAINQSSMTDNDKQTCLNHTYYVNRINVSMSQYIDDLNAIPQGTLFVDKVNMLRLRFAKEVSAYIMNIAAMQIDEYSKIISIISK